MKRLALNEPEFGAEIFQHGNNTDEYGEWSVPRAVMTWASGLHLPAQALRQAELRQAQRKA